MTDKREPYSQDLKNTIGRKTIDVPHSGHRIPMPDVKPPAESGKPADSASKKDSE